MKTARITFLTTPEFKANLAYLAAQQNTSVAEIIRGRFERSANGDENELAALVADLKVATAEAHASLREGLAEAERTLRELHKAPSARKAKAVA